MMRIDKDELIAELNLKAFGQKGWFTSKDECPYCGKGGKNGILFMENNQSAIFHCFKCGEKHSIIDYLIRIDRKDLISNDYQMSKKSVNLTPLLREAQSEECDEIKSTQIPVGLRPLINDPYLDSRHFMKEHYEEFEPSYTKSILESKLAEHNHIIFKLKEGDRVVAWLARSRYNKEWHEKNLSQFKSGEGKLVLRYMNSTDGFSHVLGGYNYISKDTRIVILVEGLFDKVNIDYLMQLRKNDEVVCCFTFGKKISPGQLKLLKSTHVEQIILMYDEDALKESKENALNLAKHFNVKVCRIKDHDIDPGNMTLAYLTKTLAGMKSPLDFYLSNLETKLL